MGVRRFVEAPAAARLRLRCGALLVVPFVVTGVAEVASRVLTTAPSGFGTFIPTPQVMMLSVLGVAVYALVFTFQLRRLRGHLTEDFWPRLRGRSMGRQNPWLSGVALFALLGMLVPQVLCGAVNRTIGQVTVESWRVQGKEDNRTSRGCEWRVYVGSRTNDDATRVCVTHERWESLRVDDSLALMAIFSGLGAEIGLAPETNQRVGGR